jgi:hypothetical protein
MQNPHGSFGPIVEYISHHLHASLHGEWCGTNKDCTKQDEKYRQLGEQVQEIFGEDFAQEVQKVAEDVYKLVWDFILKNSAVIRGKYYGEKNL